jgi:hypothetical protein
MPRPDKKKTLKQNHSFIKLSQTQLTSQIQNQMTTQSDMTTFKD